MKKTFLLVVVLLLAGAGCSTTSNTTITPPAPETQENTDTTTDSGEVNEAVLEVGVDIGMDVGVEVEQDVVDVTVVGTNMVFDQKEIRVKKGDKVRVTFKNEEGFHDWVLDEFNVKTKQLTAGQEEVVEFIADKIGSFEYYCAVGKHRELGMVGTLIVE